MIKLLQDDFVEACELDILRGALKWAEQVARDKEPDLLNKRKKEPSADLVRNALAPLLPYLRLEHVLPTNCPYVAKIFQVHFLISAQEFQLTRLLNYFTSYDQRWLFCGKP